MQGLPNSYPLERVGQAQDARPDEGDENVGKDLQRIVGAGSCHLGAVCVLGNLYYNHFIGCTRVHCTALIVHADEYLIVSSGSYHLDGTFMYSITLE